MRELGRRLRIILWNQTGCEKALSSLEHGLARLIIPPAFLLSNCPLSLNIRLISPSEDGGLLSRWDEIRQER